LPVAGAILADQIKSLDWRVRKAKRMGIAPQEVVEEVLGKVSALVGGYEPPR
jgi:mRNA interferase MazF